MRGNWLYYRGRWNAFPFQVEQITKKKVGYHAEPGKNRMQYLRLNEEVQPIPLTAELLEKNGFYRVPQSRCANPYYWRMTVREGGTGHLIYTIEAYETFFRGMLIYIYNPADCETVRFSKQLGFVHQLQNALRLCGIEKEIIAY